MSEIIDINRVFPVEEYPPIELLGGFEDWSDGHQATRYFESLSESDRDILIFFARKDITPINIDYYVRDLAVSYVEEDPERQQELEIMENHEEIARLKRFTKLFLACDRFFPKLSNIERNVYDAEGKLMHKETLLGWKNLWQHPPNSSTYKLSGERTMELLEIVDRFIDDPGAAPEVLNKNKIIADHQT